MAGAPLTPDSTAPQRNTDEAGRFVGSRGFRGLHPTRLAWHRDRYQLWLDAIDAPPSAPEMIETPRAYVVAVLAEIGRELAAASIDATPPPSRFAELDDAALARVRALLWARSANARLRAGRAGDDPGADPEAIETRSHLDALYAELDRRGRLRRALAFRPHDGTPPARIVRHLLTLDAAGADGPEADHLRAALSGRGR